MSTHSVASVAELEVIKQWVKEIAGLSDNTEVEPCLPQSKFFLKILGVLYWDSNSSLSITPAQVVEANVIPSKRGELERASTTWAGVIERDELESQ